MVKRLCMLFLICLLLPACGAKPAFDLNTLRPPQETALNTLPGASMEVEAVQATCLTVKITLDSTLPDDNFLTGESFWLDYCFQEQWYAVPLAEGKGLGFTDIAYLLTPGSSRVLPELPYYTFYGALPPGRYRVVKSLSRGYGMEREEFYLSAEFEIQEDTFS